MLSMVIWVVALAGSIAAICMTVAMDSHAAHVGATALITIGLVAAAVNDHRAGEMAGDSAFKLAATAARYLGLLWAWSAIATYVVYALLLDWSQWVPTVVAMVVGCVMCLFVALVLDREAASDSPDENAVSMVTWLARSQFAFGAIILGIVAAVQNQPEYVFGGTHKWVAINIALCTAVGLLTLTGYLMLQTNRQSTETPAAG
jgi:hypothetical protein